MTPACLTFIFLCIRKNSAENNHTLALKSTCKDSEMSATIKGKKKNVYLNDTHAYQNHTLQPLIIVFSSFSINLLSARLYFVMTFNSPINFVKFFECGTHNRSFFPLAFHNQYFYEKNIPFVQLAIYYCKFLWINFFFSLLQVHD